MAYSHKRWRKRISSVILAMRDTPFDTLFLVETYCIRVSLFFICFCNICLITLHDLYDGRIVSYVIGDHNDTSLVFATFDQAISENPGAEPLCHSDRGFQYTTRTFHKKLEAVGMTQSMSRVAKCIDKGPMEGFWGILKRERYYGKRFGSREELVSMIENYIDYYNNERYQRRLGVLTPMEKHNSYLRSI
ncbi:MAG: IS3 family transposase [Peptococcus niger]|nr:IS3 family transposase [Peptococcus niger]